MISLVFTAAKAIYKKHGEDFIAVHSLLSVAEGDRATENYKGQPPWAGLFHIAP